MRSSGESYRLFATLLALAASPLAATSPTTVPVADALGTIQNIAPSLDAIGDSKIFPAVGAGLRWQVSRETPINLRVDYARGEDSDALYISVGEAFQAGGCIRTMELLETAAFSCFWLERQRHLLAPILR